MNSKKFKKGQDIHWILTRLGKFQTFVKSPKIQRNLGNLRKSANLEKFKVIPKIQKVQEL